MAKTRKSPLEKTLAAIALATKPYSGVGRPRKQTVSLADLSPRPRSPGRRPGKNTTPHALKIIERLIPSERKRLDYHEWREKHDQRDSNRTAIRFILAGLNRNGRRQRWDEGEVKTIANALAKIRNSRPK